MERRQPRVYMRSRRKNWAKAVSCAAPQEINASGVSNAAQRFSPGSPCNTFKQLISVHTKRIFF